MMFSELKIMKIIEYTRVFSKIPLFGKNVARKIKKIAIKILITIHSSLKKISISINRLYKFL